MLEPAQRAISLASPASPWAHWVSEILADFWAVACLGVSATVGLLAVVTLPRAFVFRSSESDVHPTPYVRTLLSAELGARLFPDPQWERLADTWRQLYPLDAAAPDVRAQFAAREAELPVIADALAGLRFPSLGRTLAEHLRSSARSPSRLRALFASRAPASPLSALAALGQARADGTLAPEAEALRLDELLRIGRRSAAASADTRRQPKETIMVDSSNIPLSSAPDSGSTTPCSSACSARRCR